MRLFMDTEYVLKVISYQELVELDTWIFNQGGIALKVGPTGINVLKKYKLQRYIALAAAKDENGKWIYLIAKDPL
jgi:hypothetical protein